MMSDLEIYRAAQATIQAYGDGAGLHAAQRADALSFKQRHFSVLPKPIFVCVRRPSYAFHMPWEEILFGLAVFSMIMMTSSSMWSRRGLSILLYFAWYWTWLILGVEYIV